MNAPFFSIVIPVYNRQREIRRAIDSCLSQDHSNFEVILVDDASQDDSIQVIASYADPRVRLVCHAKNRGECPARNTGVEASKGEWVVFVDSDHALKPGALSRIRQHLDSDLCVADRIGFMQDWDTGIVTPQPAPDGSLLDYKGWMHFIQSALLSDFLLCTRRSTFDSVKWPDSSVAPTEYHLDFALKFTTRLIPETLAIQYTDSSNRLTAGHKRPGRAQLKGRAGHDMASKKRMLERHGEALRRFAPRIHELTYRVLVLSCFIRGEWLEGFRHAAHYFASCKIDWDGAGSIALAGIWTEGFLRVRHRRMLRG